ncbi:MAG: NUDIX hydrolase [Acidimicrobiales bacterium]
MPDDDRPPVRAAGGVVVDTAGRVAVVHRPAHDDWSLPKGHLETGESHRDAAMREVFEETGLRCRIVGEAGRVAYRVTDRRGTLRDKRVRYFLMEPVGDVAADFVANDEVDELRWIGPGEETLLSYPADADLARAVFDQREL